MLKIRTRLDIFKNDHNDVDNEYHESQIESHGNEECLGEEFVFDSGCVRCSLSNFSLYSDEEDVCEILNDLLNGNDNEINFRDNDDETHEGYFKIEDGQFIFTNGTCGSYLNGITTIRVDYKENKKDIKKFIKYLLDNIDNFTE